MSPLESTVTPIGSEELAVSQPSDTRLAAARTDLGFFLTIEHPEAEHRHEFPFRIELRTRLLAESTTYTSPEELAVCRGFLNSPSFLPSFPIVLTYLCSELNSCTFSCIQIPSVTQMFPCHHGVREIVLFPEPSLPKLDK